MHIETVVLTIGNPQLRVVVLDEPFRRTIDLQWVEKDGPTAPPENWVDSVVGECSYQRSVELAQQKGMPRL